MNSNSATAPSTDALPTVRVLLATAWAATTAGFTVRLNVLFVVALLASVMVTV